MQTQTPYTTNRWTKLAKRLEAAARSVKGACIVRCDIIALNGEPRLWLRPDVRPFEPRKDVEALGYLLGDDGGIVELSDEGEPK